MQDFKDKPTDMDQFTGNKTGAGSVTRPVHDRRGGVEADSRSTA
jgi:hypothetical protein